MKECEIGANVGRLQVSKLGCFLFGRHRGGRLDQVLRLKHALQRGRICLVFLHLVATLQQ